MRNDRASFTQGIITAAKELTVAAKNIIELHSGVSPELCENLLTEAERNAYVADETYKQHGNPEDDSKQTSLNI